MNSTETPKLVDIFKMYNKRDFVFIKPGGNWGDYLIYWGAEYLADSLGIKYRSVEYGDFDFGSITQDEVVYVHGSGGFNPWCSGSAAACLKQAILSDANIIIQGPSSYDDENGYVSKFFSILENELIGKDKEIFVFAREQYSFELLEKILADSVVQLCFDIDTALHLSREVFLQKAGGVNPRYDLIALREDNEAPGDGGVVGKGIRLDPAIYAQSFEQWVKIHAAAKSIMTNRTHSSVAGAILGVPTTLLAGSYHKNKSIWEAALRERGVIWGEYVPAGIDVSDRKLERFLPAIVKNSWKVQRFLNWLKGVPSS